MDLDAVRTFLAAADAGRFQDAATDLAITPQAVSKRIAALESELGVRLFTRTPRGARLTVDGQAFLPHARTLLHAERRALASVRAGRRALRIDVIDRKLAPAALLREFHRFHPDVELDVVTLFDLETAVAAVRSGSIDASFRAVTGPAALREGVIATRVHNEPLQLLVGPGHQFATAEAVAIKDIAGQRIWMPGIVVGTEWASYYSELATAFGLTIDVSAPEFGAEPLLDAVHASPDLATFVGEQTRVLWPDHYDMRRIRILDPTPVYPHSLIRRVDSTHIALSALCDHLGSAYDAAGTWTPGWARKTIGIEQD